MKYIQIKTDMYSTHYSTRRDKIIVKGVKKLDCQKYCKMHADFQLTAWDANHSCFVFVFFCILFCRFYDDLCCLVTDSFTLVSEMNFLLQLLLAASGNLLCQNLSFELKVTTQIYHLHANKGELTTWTNGPHLS